MVIHRGLMLAAGVCGFTGVLAGTFGAHGLKGRLAENLLSDYHTGVLYHLIHAVALLGVAIVAASPALSRSRVVVAAGWCMLVGIVVFSGSLYALAITGAKWLGMVTPFGGVSFLVGWALLAVAAWPERPT
jgi:uncharacterized membrane protein YgdD (TMEM256/DUF423 family)